MLHLLEQLAAALTTTEHVQSEHMHVPRTMHSVGTSVNCCKGCYWCKSFDSVVSCVHHSVVNKCYLCCCTACAKRFETRKHGS